MRRLGHTVMRLRDRSQRFRDRCVRAIALAGLAAFCLGTSAHAQTPPAGAPSVADTMKDTLKDAVKGAVSDAKAKLPGATPAAAVPAAGVPAPATAPPAVAPPAVAPPAAAGVPGVPTAGAPAAPAGPATPADRAVMLRKKTLKDDDFVENEEQNRDPFHSYVSLFSSPPKKRTGNVVPAIFEKFALEELTLIAIISGDANPRAMFRDPAGQGQVVKRGDYLSKVAARVSKILSDRVIIEMEENTGSAEGPRTFEKAILVNPEESQP